MSSNGAGDKAASVPVPPVPRRSSTLPAATAVVPGKSATKPQPERTAAAATNKKPHTGALTAPCSKDPQDRATSGSVPGINRLQGASNIKQKEEKSKNHKAT